MGKLCDDWLVPPFSVLDARQGYWQKRKKEWIALGIRGEEGRAAWTAPMPFSAERPGVERWGPEGNRKRNGRGQARAFREDLAKGERHYQYADKQNASLPEKDKAACGCYAAPNGQTVQRPGGMAGTSVFDPVLAELSYLWFCPPGGKILDPFAGEATKGIVAEYLGYKYTGVELRPEQVENNNQQAAAVGVRPTWICGDSSNLDALLPAGEYRLMFTSPPYYNLEIYSDDETDGSTKQTYDEFLRWYANIFRQAVARLAPDSFAVVKVGEIRDERGNYRGFVPDTIETLSACGLQYYNEAVLITPVGSLPVRTPAQFSRYRKLGKSHQNILIFYKGESRKIREHYPQQVAVKEAIGPIAVSG